MFENVLHQDATVNRLRNDILSGTLPSALLFSGASNSGKITAALELARVLSCEKKGAWNCVCPVCRLHRELDYPYTLMTGYRYLIPEISAFADVFSKFSSTVPQLLFVRSIKKLIRRFDPVLWEGDEKKILDIQEILEELMEKMDKLSPEKILSGSIHPREFSDDLIAACSNIQKKIPSILPIRQVRNIISWAFLSPGNKIKIVIIDSIENMQNPSVNALLKFLESPPSNTVIILTTTREAALLPTLKSRLRVYKFLKRKLSEESDVLYRIFREDNNSMGIDSFFRQRHSGVSQTIKSTAEKFVAQARGKNNSFPEESMAIRDSGELLIFLNFLIDVLRKDLRERILEKSNSNHRQRFREAELIRLARYRFENLNIPASHILRWLYASLGNLS